jgi:hypothetical protein
MSHRRGAAYREPGERRTALDAEFDTRGLVRVNTAARELGVDREVVRRHVPTVQFDYKGTPQHGVRRWDLDVAVSRLAKSVPPRRAPGSTPL